MAPVLLAVLGGCDPDVPPVGAGDRKLDPGTVVLHRLNRDEYDRTLRDLVGTALTPSAAFPVDASGYGFDNNAAALSVSPLLVELHEVAIDDVLDELFGVVPPPAPLVIEAEAMEATVGAAYGAAWMLWSTGSLTTTWDVAVDARYAFAVTAWSTAAGDEVARMEVAVDGVVVATIDVPNPVTDPGRFAFDVDAVAGVHDVSIAFVNDYWLPYVADRNLIVDSLEIAGPLDLPAVRGPAWATVVPCDPDASGEDACAEQTARAFLPRAWRRPVTDDEVSDLLGLYAAARDLGEPWDVGLRQALKGALMSHHFLFRVELDPDPTSSVAHDLGPYELASRLSYFLWSTMPDELLFASAADGSLLRDDVLRSQVLRMVADPRAHALVDNLAGQWLGIRAVDTVTPDVWSFPDWDEDLRASAREEMERLAADALLEGAPMTELLVADATWIDARLAAHYGLTAPVEGWSHVSVEGAERGGWLTTTGLLVGTSYPTRTSPVKRGKWVLGSLLCQAPPPPPPEVDALLLDDTGAPLSLRDQLAQHRADPVCASCHATMDPIGLALEHYDGIGAWRSVDADGIAIDSSGVLPDGTPLADARDLGIVVAADPAFPACVVQQVFTYAIGRAPGVEDVPTLEAIEADFVVGGATFEALATAIALSAPFRQRHGEGP